MIINKWFLSILLLFFCLYGCTNTKENNVILEKNIIPLKVMLNDSLGLVILSPKGSKNLKYSNEEIKKSLCFFLMNNRQMATKSILLIKNFSLYGKIPNDSCSSKSKNKTNCDILKKNWLGIYNDSKTITIFPYDERKKEYFKCDAKSQKL